MLNKNSVTVFGLCFLCHLERLFERVLKSVVFENIEEDMRNAVEVS